MFFTKKKTDMVSADAAIAGREAPLPLAKIHHVFGREMTVDVPEGHEVAIFGMGCYWGVERIFWQQPGVWMTMVGNAGGFTENPTYEEVCTAQTGHAEVVRVTFDTAKTSFEALLKAFWENHDPTQGMRQGNDSGTQYRSAIFATSDAQLAQAKQSATEYGARLSAQGYGAITTEITRAGPFYWAEDYHQQYLSKNPAGYCGIGGTGVTCPIGTGA